VRRIAAELLTFLVGVGVFLRTHLGRPVSPQVRRRRLVAGGAVIAVVAAVQLLVLDGSDGTSSAGGAGEQNAAHVRSGQAMAGLASRIGRPWLDRRAESGLFIDPITQGAGHGYGPAMLAEVLMRDGARRDDRRMLAAGMHALEENANRAANDDQAGNPLELFATASAYRWAERKLAGDRAWQRRRAEVQDYLRRWEFGEVGAAAQRCFASPTCWSNYKIIDVAATLLLLDSGLDAATPAALLARPDEARMRVMSVLEHALPRAMNTGAEARGSAGTLRGLGLLSDQPTYALAYHALSVAALARALQLLGEEAPPVARDRFRAAMLAGTAFAGPDGDVAYMGRAQGESWALGATAYAGEACARMFRASHPRTAGMCATLAARSVRRLDRLHGFNRGLFSIVPRLGFGDLTPDGLERYARVGTFNGMTAMFLEWGSEEARAAAGVEPLPLPLDRGGAFVDPDQAHLAVVRHGSVWYAVHTIGPKGTDDLRYDFGVVSLKVRRGRRWVDVQPPRPLNTGTGRDSAGPSILTPDGMAFPQGTSFTVDEESGEVVVRGGFRTDAGVWTLRRVTFRYAPARRGVVATVEAPPGTRLRYQDFLPEEWTQALEGSRVLQTPVSESRLSEPPPVAEEGFHFASSYAAGLRGYVRYVDVPASGRVSWVVEARSRP
jgi:hypothetical protein